MLQESVLIVILLVLFAITVTTVILWQDAKNKLFYLHGKFNPFKQKQYFLTKNEKDLFLLLHSLEELQNFYIFPQLHLSTLLQVKDEARDMMGKFEYINKLFVDFVIFDKNLNPVVVIELNDQSHLWNSRKSRDQFVVKALEDSNIPLLTINTIDSYQKNTVQLKLLPFLTI